MTWVKNATTKLTIMGIKIGIGRIRIGTVGSQSWESYWASLISATVENAAPTHVVLTFPSAKTELTDTDFTVTVNGVARTVSSASWTGAVITLVLASNVIVGDTVVVTFVPSGGTTNVINNVGEAEVILYLTGLITPLSQATRVKINTIVTGLKSGLSITNLSDAFDVMYILAGETAESSLRNIVKNAHHATAVNSPTFAALEGFQGDGIGSYINTNYKPSDHAFRLSQDNGHLSVYIRNDVTTNYVCGCLTGPNATICPKIVTTNKSFHGINGFNANEASSHPEDSKGLWLTNRVDSTQCTLYRNKGSLGTASRNSTGISAYNYFILAANNAGSPSYNNFTAQASFLSAGKGLTQAEVDVITDAFEAYMDSNSKGVIA